MTDLMASVVTDGAGVEEEGGADHAVLRVLQHVAPIDGLRLTIVLSYETA